ncbi:hypothetical protein IAU60_001215 [Kwoniella sp. DSM 27419]
MPHALIIGGGLAGPCLALALARRDITSTIYEIRPSRGDGGGSISLPPTALRVLDKHAGVWDEIQANGYSYHRMHAYTDHGEKLGEIAAGDESEGGYPAVRIMRSKLHEILLDAVGRAGIAVNYGVKLQRIDESENGVTAHFEDGTTAKVREHVLGEAAPTPVYDGVCVVHGFVPAAAAVKPFPEYTFPSFLFTSTGMFMAIPMDQKGETLAWGINKTFEERSRAGWKELEVSGETARQAKADYAEVEVQPVRSLLDHAEETEAKMWPVYSIPRIAQWHTSRVCLIGDAAHSLPPNGQGTALAFEDAALLTRLLALDTDYARVFGRFQSLREPRVDKLRSSSKKMGAGKYETGPWVWYAKKWAFRGFFWWNSGVLRMHKGDVDVDEMSL